MLILFKEKLIRSLHADLPGIRAHQQMMVPGRLLLPNTSPSAKKAAVLVLFYKKLDRIFTALIRRKEHHLDRHSGQISFPGGRLEDGEDYPLTTALREAREEIGLLITPQILGIGSPLYIPVSDFLVTPVLAWADEDLNFRIQASEVSEILEIEYNALIDPENKTSLDLKTNNLFYLQNVPAIKIQDIIIWGATAMILSEIEMMPPSQMIKLVELSWPKIFPKFNNF